ncbi:hypothetical protein [Meridianimarinicoccus roseus]|uniref:hypothetical protein n=1 Tax=Meridianimarinicoccus roseus TaxID=2072018 RepID=UPI001EE64B41|nr:hypothetical protein [Meridianimarinicoccus roseus]
MKRLALFAAALMLLASLNAASITADLTLDFFDSGPGPTAGPYGATNSPAT